MSAAPRAPAALEGVRVLDLSDGVAGQFCGRLFADNGADVVLVEPSGGSPLRSAGPSAQVAEGRLSCLFWHLNLGKRSVVADLARIGGTELVAQLAGGADVVLLDGSARAAELLGDGGRPAVVCDITAFGREGPASDWHGGELVFQALSGTMFENGLPGRTPLYGVGHRASYAAGTLAYAQSLATLLAGGDRRRRIDVSIAEVAASMSFNRATQYSYNGTVEGRDALTIPRAIVRCADGWAAVFIYDHRWAVSCRALGLDDLIEDPRFVTEHERLAHWDEFITQLESHLGDRPVDEVLAAGQREKVIVAKAVSPLQLGGDPQLLARGFWDRADEGPLPRLGPMLGFSGTPQVDRGGAPLEGADSLDWRPRARPSTARRFMAERSVDGAGRAPGAERTPDAHQAPRDRPLRGVRVLDLTTAWSGPMATRLMATLGAEVLKVEGPARIDDWRGPIEGGLPSRYPDLEPGERPYDRCYQFNTQNHDKLGLALDLKTDAGRELALGLAAEADVMIANFSAGTLERMGLGWERLHELNRRLILVEMPAYGDGGPMGRYVALGPSMELMGGMGTMIGYGDGRPTTTGPAYLDPIGGFNSLAAILTALSARERSGLGQRVELAQREAAMHWIGEQIIAALAAGRDAPVDGNHVPEATPHDAFRCAGEEEWVAIAAFDDMQFEALCEELGLRELLSGMDLSTPAARKLQEAELGQLIALRTATREKHQLAGALQARGVPAAPVANARDLFESAFLRERGLLQVVSHPRTGTHVYQGLPLHIEGWDLAIRAPAPCFGQDTEAVLRERLGLDEQALQGLRAGGVISVRPRASEPTRAVLDA